MRTLAIVTALLLSCGAARAGDLDLPIIRGTATITDGDTIRLGPVRVRLEGIDAPEAGQQCTSADGTPWSCGAAATKYAAELAGGATVECTIIGLDKYHRLLGSCSVLDAMGRREEPSINTRMVTAGLAVAYRQLSQAYVGAEDEARAAKRGLWQGEFEMPWDYRARHKAK
jgi:endonuclease YncB( thermonuclease family)